jgi:nucleoside phosphorylase
MFQVIEVQHPDVPEHTPANDATAVRHGTPKVHYGVIGSGRPVTRADDTRLDFAGKYGIIAFDSEFDQVIESICGNRKDSFMFIRGIADYNDGSRSKEWQPYASLAAAAMMKTIIKAIANLHLSEDELDD